MRRILILFLLIPVAITHAQVVGGSSTFAFMNLAASPPAASLGGIFITPTIQSPSLIFSNVAALNPASSEIAEFNNQFLPGKISENAFAVAHHFNRIGTVAAGIQNMNYGESTRTDIYGNENGTFKSWEYAISLGVSRKYDEHFSYGVNFKFLQSSLGGYFASGLCADLGISFADTTSNWYAGLVAKNIGRQLGSYTGIREPLPFDLEFGVARRLKHTPFRFSVTAHHLQQFDIRYNDPALASTSILISDTIVKEKHYTVDKIFRHLNFGAELLIGKSLSAQLGYNYQRRHELIFSQHAGMGGFSYGFSLRLKYFKLAYSHTRYNVAGGTDMLGLQLNMSGWFFKKNL